MASHFFVVRCIRSRAAQVKQDMVENNSSSHTVSVCGTYTPAFDSSFYKSKMRYRVTNDFLNLNEIEKDITREIIDALIKNDFHYDSNGIPLDFETPKCRRMAEVLVIPSLLLRLRIETSDELLMQHFISYVSSRTDDARINFTFVAKSGSQDLRFATEVIQTSLERLQQELDKKNKYRKTLNPIEQLLFHM